MRTKPPRIPPTAEEIAAEAERAKHQAQVAESWRTHRICCAIAPKLGRTKDQMLLLEMYAMAGPRDEAEFRAWQRESIEMSLRSIWSALDKPVGAYSYTGRANVEAEIAEAFAMIRRAAAALPVVRDSKAAAELAFIRHAIEGKDNTALQSFIERVSRPD
jgi:hypothetical protein